MYVKRYAGSVPVNYNGTVFDDSLSGKASKNDTKIHKASSIKREAPPREAFVPKQEEEVKQACPLDKDIESTRESKIKESDKENHKENDKENNDLDVFDKAFLKNILKSLSAQDILLILGLVMLLFGELEDESLLIIAALIALGK